MFDFSWENIIHSNAINFVILAGIIGWLGIPRIKRAIEDKADRTAAEINNSVKAKEEAEQNLEEVKSDYAKTPQEAENIKNTALNTLKSLEQKVKEDTEKAKQAIINNTDKVIKNEVTKINTILTKEAVQTSVEESIQDIQKKLRDIEDLHDRLIEQSIEKLVQ